MGFIKYQNAAIDYIVEYMECQCMSPEHLVKFHLDLEDGDLCLDFHLANWLPWYKRIWVAIKYIFGYTSKYGHFDELIFKDQDVDKLIELLVHQKKIKEHATNL